MIHHSCDRCRRPIDPIDDVRYVVRLEVEASMEPLFGEEPDDERDHLLEVQEILERLEDGHSENISEEVYHKMRFDLCPECYGKFVRNPLGREKTANQGFSHN